MIIATGTTLLLLVATSWAAETADQKKIADASNYFGLNIYQLLTKDSSDNVFFSPLSLSTALGLLYEGARGQSQQELQDVLGYNKAELSSEKVPPAFKHLLEDLSNGGSSEDGEYYTLNNANALYIADNLPVLKNYIDEAKEYFKALVQNVDFDNDNQKVISQINDFVSENTNGKIENFVSELDASTVMFIVNAVYFLGSWDNPFNPNKTEVQTYYNGGSSSDTSQVEMMHIKEDFRYTTIDDTQVLEMPYLGNDISMVIFLPKQADGLAEFESQLSSDKFAQVLKQLHKNEVNVSFPKFKLEYSKDLSPQLKSLGANSIFSDVADLSGITEGSGLKVSEVSHKAVIDVNEKGSEAAAATGIKIVPLSIIVGQEVQDFVADHPFLFTIVDKRNGMILFVGRVSKL